MNIENETLNLSWSAGSLPQKIDNIEVLTGITELNSTVPEFTGQSVSISGDFTGVEQDIKITYTPNGEIS